MMLLLALTAIFPPLHQSVEAAVDDLQIFNVTFEEGAIDEAELAELEDRAQQFTEPDAVFKVVVLAEPVDDGTITGFAADVLDGLGEPGRLIVLSPDEVAVVSNVDPDETIQRALEAAAAAGADTVAAVRSAGEVFSGAEPVGTGSSGGGSNTGWILIALVGIVIIVVLVAYVLKRRQGTAALGEAERSVRDAVDRAANLVLSVAEKADLPDAPEEAKNHFQEGADLFAKSQDLLEEADTPAELQAVYAQILESVWKLETAAALFNGTPPPPRPEVKELFPAPAPGPDGEMAQQPEFRGYRSWRRSPWLTQAALAAIAMLAMRRGDPTPMYRRPMGDGWFGGGGGFFGGGGGWSGGGGGFSGGGFGGGGSRAGGRARGGSMFRGGGRRGMGSRSSGRGMGRRR